MLILHESSLPMLFSPVFVFSVWTWELVQLRCLLSSLPPSGARRWVLSDVQLTACLSDPHLFQISLGCLGFFLSKSSLSNGYNPVWAFLLIQKAPGFSILNVIMMNVEVTTGKRAVSYNSGITNCSVHCVFMMPCACMYSRQNSKTHFSVFKNQDTRFILIRYTLVEKNPQICKIGRRAEDNGNWVIKQVTHRTCSATSMVFCNFFNKSKNFFWC